MQGKGPRRIVCLNAASTDETLGQYSYATGFALRTYVIQSNGITSGGVITFEEASWDQTAAAPYTGTWSAITTVNASDVNTGSSSGTAQKFVHVQSTAFAATRPRISDAITGGGTISVFLHEEGN